ncbi:MFS transporter [Clostridium sp.]|uniref:MFS transporter n=1 Tax=Clostridium sp. TaxID=1506 RepID=UPI00290D3219|nr:MFS transporter [Clostridium sp.]MDU5105322.1 MFS transporter [Clostridium sp.]
MNKRINIYLLNIIIFLQGLIFYAPIATIYRENRGVSISQIFLIESIYMVLIILLEIPWGRFADKFGYKRTLILANFIFFISKIFFFKADSFFMFFIERLLLAISISGLSGCDSALLFLSLDEKDNSERAFARYDFFSNLGFLLGSILSTFIINVSMDLAAFYTIIPYGVAFLLSFLLKDVKGKSLESIGIIKNLKCILQKRNILIFVIAIALVTEVVQSITVFLNQGIYIKSNIDVKYFGLILAAIQIIKLISIKSYKITNKIGQKTTIKLFIMVIFISSFALIFIRKGFLAFTGIALIATSMAFIEPIFMDIKNKSIETVDRATLLSIYSMLGSIISAVINPVIGFAANYSLEGSLIVCSIISLISMIFIGVNKDK